MLIRNRGDISSSKRDDYYDACESKCCRKELGHCRDQALEYHLEQCRVETAGVYDGDGGTGQTFNRTVLAR